MPTVAEFLMQRMEDAGVKHVFGVPGDYVLGFYKKLNDNPKIEVVGCTDENHAGFAANAYSRINGVGAICVTYNVGALKIANSVACAYAERCPVVVISGSPGIKERKEGMLLHHMVRSFECQREVFENLTCASIVLDDPSTAGYKIDEAFEAMQHHKQPIYIELPRDVANKSISYDVYRQGTPTSPITDEQNLIESLEEVREWIANARKPVILAGVQLARHSLGSLLMKWAEKSNIPFATTLLAKSLINEQHPLHLGVYAGVSSKPEVKEAVEESDCLLMFGVLLTDMTTAFMPVAFKKRNTVDCAIEGLKVKNHAYPDVQFVDFCNNLFKSDPIPKESFFFSQKKEKARFEPVEGKKITASRFFNKIDSILNETHSVIADVGDCLFGAADLTTYHESAFIASAFYTSMGNSIPGALGMALAQPNKRPIVLVGDGAFQMCFGELSTIVRRGFNPIVFVLNNKGYTTERFLLDGSFNDISNWEYHKIVEVLGGIGDKVDTEEKLEISVANALKSDKMYVINVEIDKLDTSDALKRMTSGLAKKV